MTQNWSCGQQENLFVIISDPLSNIDLFLKLSMALIKHLIFSFCVVLVTLIVDLQEVKDDIIEEPPTYQLTKNVSIANSLKKFIV